MIGYHYTTIENWYKIQVDGLIPYIPVEYDLPGVKVNHIQLKKAFNGTVPKCIWVWKYQLTQPTHLGTLLFQVVTKTSFEICVIQVEYNQSDLLKPPILRLGQNVNYTHTGEIGAWKYHSDVPFELLKKRIPSKRLRLVESFDFVTLTKFHHS
jgi:hypothetical protein